MSIAVDIMTCFIDHLISLRHFKCLSRLTIRLPRAPSHCKKRVFRKTTIGCNTAATDFGVWTHNFETQRAS